MFGRRSCKTEKQMLDIHARAAAPSNSPTPIEFVTIQLMPLADGTTSVSLKSTVFDEVELELIDQDIARECVATLDELLALIRAHVRVAPALM